MQVIYPDHLTVTGIAGACKAFKKMYKLLIVL